MARAGSKNWEANWKGSDKQSVVKTPATYYRMGKYKSFQPAGQLVKDTAITYIDSLTESHTKAAFKLAGSDEVFYANIDKFVKPGQLGGVDLTPQSFGLSGQTFNNGSIYYTKVIDSLTDKWDEGKYSGELYDYLFQILEYAKTGNSDYSGIKTNGFPWGAIQSYFGEVAGPLACIFGGILNNIVPGNLTGASIYIPPSSTGLYDYKLISNRKEYLISAKAGKGVSNQVKPQFVTSAVKNVIDFSLKSTDAYKLIEILGSSSVILGAFLGWQLIQSESILNDVMIADIRKNYDSGAKSGNKLSSLDIWDPFLKKYFSGRVKKNITYGELRYKCETLIQNASKQGVLNLDLKKIFELYLNQSRVVYVKMSVQPTNSMVSFSASDSGDAKIIRTLYLRTSNDSRTRTSDRIGFQVS